MAVLSVLSLVFTVITLVAGASKRSSMFGKILIFGGVLGLLTLLVEQGTQIADIEAVVRTFATVTGLFLSRISPHKQLKKFMFLAIATKVQFIGVTAFITYAEAQQVGSIVPLYYWYGIVGLMAVSVPVLAVRRLNAYRIMVWGTTLVSIALLLQFLQARPSPVLTTVAVSLVLWPAIIARALGRHVFFGSG